MNVFVTDGEFGPLPTPAPQRAPPTPPPPDNSAAIIGSAIGGVSKFYADPNFINPKYTRIEVRRTTIKTKNLLIGVKYEVILFA